MGTDSEKTAAAPGAAPTAADDPELAAPTERAQRLHQHLEELDRTLRHRRLQIEGMLAHRRQPDGDWRQEVAGIRRHLRSLAATVHGWEPGEGDQLPAKIRALEPLVESLERRYQQDAERSPRDHRLPLVLARLAAARGDAATAVETANRLLCGPR